MNPKCTICNAVWGVNGKYCRKCQSRLRKAAPDMLEALKALKVRIAFIGMPQEPFRNDRMGKIPDWRKELALLEAALDKAGGNLSLEEFKTAIKKMKGK